MVQNCLQIYTRDMQGDAKEEVRAKLSIEDVIGEYVQLKRAGRNFKGLSPFGEERTPSFFVSPDKQIWHDFSSNRGGDVFSFVMEAEGMDFRQALEHLARKAGVDLSVYESAGSRDLAKRKKRLAEANQLAMRYYQTCLVRNQTALEYVFKKRRLSKDIVQEFLIGYAPDSGRALVTALDKKGFSSREITEAGLANRYGGDLYRGRMMVPLMDASGQVIGFTGRIIGDVENAPKYLNTPQTLLYDKGRHVFGLSQAKEAIRQENFVVIVEGNLDVVSSHQAEVKNVVATAGTAMTESHLRALNRLTGDIRLCFDGDAAGIAATERAIGIASGLGIELAIVTLPASSKDPDELIQKDIEAWRQAIATTQPAVEWVIDQYAAREDLATAAGKRRFTSAALALVARLNDGVEREHYEVMIAEKTDSTRQVVHDKAEKLKQPEPEKKPVKKTLSEHSQGRETAYQDDLLAITMIDVPSQELLASINPELFATPERQALAHYVGSHRGKRIDETPVDLREIDTYVKIVQLKADTRYADMSEDDRYFETARLVRMIEHEHLKQTRDTLTDHLRQAELDGDETQAETLRKELNNLIKEIARGKR